MTDTGFDQNVGGPSEPSEPSGQAPGAAPAAASQGVPGAPGTADAPGTPGAFGAPGAAFPAYPAFPAFAAFAPPDPQAAERKARRKRALLRWTGAVALVAVVGGGIGFALTLPKRSDLPGLGTASDGRFVFPALTLPALPSGDFPPGDATDNPGGRHLADIRQLLLPLPRGAVALGPPPGRTGWLSAAATDALSTDPTMGQTFAEFGLRHTAAEGWTASFDGSTTKLYILQFVDDAAATQAVDTFSAELSGIPAGASQSDYRLSKGDQATYAVAKSRGEVTRIGSYATGDALVLEVQTGPADLSSAPFFQVLTLQFQMLQ